MTFNLDCPYTKMDLTIAMLGLEQKLEKIGEENLKQVLEKEFKTLNKPLNKEAAKFHGVTVKELIDSPNFEKLQKQYMDSAVNKLVSNVCKKLDLEPVEVWSLIAASIDNRG